MNLMMSLSILDPLYKGFGTLLRILYDWLQNYGLVIIVFSLAIKLLLLPINLRMQKGMSRQLFLQDDINEIKRVYADEPQRAQEAQMELMKSAGISVTSGCLPQLVQFLILIAIWRPIQQPLHYIAGVSLENLTNIAGLLVEKGIFESSALQLATRTDVNILSALRENSAVLAESLDNGWITLNQILDLNFLGMDLGKIPSFKPALIFGAETRSTYLPLLILVIVMVATMFISLKIAKLNQEGSTSKEEKERDKRNPAKQAQTKDQSAGLMRGMNIFMPLMMLYMAFTVPAAMAIYWIITNVTALLQAVLSYFFYTKPAKQLIAERKAEKQIPRRRRASMDEA